MSEENINYKKLTPKYLIEAEKFFPPDWSYDKNRQFREITSDYVLDCVNVLQQQDCTMEQIDYFMRKVSNWCAWSYIDAEAMFLEEIYLQKMLSSLIYKLSDTYINCIRKERPLEECDEILDEIAKDKFTQIVEAYLSKGIITKHQAIDAKRRNAKEFSPVNIEFNNENTKNLKLLFVGLGVVFGISPLIIALVAELNVFTVMASSIMIAILCYWLYITILNHKLRNQHIVLAPMPSGGNGGTNPTGNGGGASNSGKSQGKQGNVNQFAVKQEISSGNDTRGLVQDRGIRSLILVRAGKTLMPYTQGYIEGSLPVFVAKLRNKLIAKYQFELPPVQVQEDVHLGDCEYRIIIRRKETYEDLKGTIIISTKENAKPPMEQLANQIEKCVERHIDKLKGWKFAKNARAEDFKDDL